MAVPKKKTSRSKRGLRRAGQHHKLHAKSVLTDTETGEYTLPHRISPSGRYKNIQYFTIKTAKEKSDTGHEEKGTV